MKDKILEQFDAELSQSSSHTRGNRHFYAEKFLDFAGDRPLYTWNKSLVHDFLSSLRGEGYAPGLIRFVYSVVKRVFDAAKAVHEAERVRLISRADPSNPGAVAEILKAMSLPGPTWDLGKRAAPKVRSSDEVKPSLTLDEIGTMVRGARKGLLEPPEAAFLALDSVYGYRLGELRTIRPEHIDYRKRTLFVLTEKGGEQREQLLADEIIPYLKDHDFNQSYSQFQMYAMFLRIEHKVGLVHKEGGGWHQFKRAMDTEILQACKELEDAPPAELCAHFFLRWKMSSSMVERYYSRSLLEIDAKVLSVHPVLPLWR